MNEDKTETNKDKKGSLEAILALAGTMGILSLNSCTVYSLLEKAGVYAQLYNSETQAAANSAIFQYVGLNLPVAFCAATGAFVIGKYIGSWLDKMRK